GVVALRSASGGWTKWVWNGRWTEAEASGQPGRGLGRRPRLRLGGVRRRRGGDRLLRPGLPAAAAGGGRSGFRAPGLLQAPAAAARILAPSRDRGPGLRLPGLLRARLGGRHLRRPATPSPLRAAAGRGDQLRPQDTAQRLLLDLDQPARPLSGRGVCLGLPVWPLSGCLNP